ncbi:MAG TPA: hypothetical protein VKG26_02715, partial [Bacteroidia bacterium]|nr:hypothetical protein [Bacteroidia bacterium]
MIEKIFPEIPTSNTDKEFLFSVKRITSFLLTLIQLVALLFVIKKLNIEKSSGISAISLFIIISFILTSFTSLRFRPFIFFATALYVIYFAFGFFSGSLLIIGAITLL